jgi:hypothetical protein
MDSIPCDKCNETGFESELSLCPSCFGTGTLNWIENLFGKPQGFYNREIYEVMCDAYIPYKDNIANNENLRKYEDHLNEIFLERKFKFRCECLYEKKGNYISIRVALKPREEK